MTVGPIVMGVASLMLLGVGEDVNYWLDVLPGLTVFGLGLSLMVAPLTATVLAAAPNEHAGIASGINNAVARAGSLLAVAALPVAVGLSGDDYADPAVFDAAFREATHHLRRAADPRRHRLLAHHPGVVRGGRCHWLRRAVRPVTKPAEAVCVTSWFRDGRCATPQPAIPTLVR